jgi:hypothetical protein
MDKREAAEKLSIRFAREIVNGHAVGVICGEGF